MVIGPEFNTLLNQLGLPIDGNVTDYKRRFIKYTGLLNSYYLIQAYTFG